jgi:hypothetical protein
LHRLVTSARSSIKDDDAVPVGSSPLVPDFFGEHVAKKDMTIAFITVAKASGMPEDTRITGHSPRATGAQLMAKAGVSEWKIQVFGRWGSSAVLGYLRDALIQGAAGAIAREVAQPALHELQAQLGVDILAQEAAFERGLRAKSRGGAVPASVGQVVASLRAELAEVRSELESAASRSVPALVVCTASGKTHIVANSCVTHCGWPWAARPGAYCLSDTSEFSNCCRKCCARADRLKREQQPRP